MPNQEALDIAALIERLGRLFATDAHTQGLLPVHWESLRYINKANQFSRTHAGLTAYLGLTKGTVSQTLKALESKGLVSKEADQHDRRSKRLGLTTSGRRLLRRDPVGRWVDHLATLPDADREGLVRTLSTLLTQRLAAQNQAPFGQCHACSYFVAAHDDGKPHYCDLLQVGLSRKDATLICAEQKTAH